MATESRGKAREFTNESVNMLRALGSNLTAFEGSQEDLLSFQPEKFEVGFTDTKTTEDGAVPGVGDTESTVRNFSQDVFTQGAVDKLKEQLLPGIQARLSSIRTQRDRPGRGQLLSTSLLG